MLHTAVTWAPKCLASCTAGRPDGAGGAVDEHAPPLERAGLPQARQRERRTVADRRSLFEAHAGRLVRQRAALPDAGELRVRARALDAEDLVADLELGHGRTDRLDLSGELAAEDRPLRPHETGDEAADELLGAAKPGVRPSDGRRVDPDEDLVVLGHRPLDLLEPQNLGRPVPVVDDCSHAFTSQVRGKR